MTRALNIVAPICDDKRPALDRLLAAIAADLPHNGYVPFAALPTTHFARFVVIPPPHDRSGPSLLVFESNYDGRRDEYFDHLLRVAGRGLDALFGCCVGWPDDGLADHAGCFAFLRKHCRRTAAYHLGYRGHEKASVLNDLAVFAAIQEWLARAEAERATLAGLPATELRRRIARDVAATHPHLSLAPGPPDPHWLWVALLWWLAIPLGLGVLLFALLVAPKEARDAATKASDPSLPVAELDRLRFFEDRRGVVQNQLTHLSTPKRGVLRFVALRFVLFTVDLLSRFYFNQGSLGGITTIHFARWLFLDDGRLLFLSNYDGSWESYLGEFVDRAHRGLTGVWSHTERFPRSRFMVGAGATDEEAFKKWTRACQLPSQVWWSSYPAYSIDNIRNAIAVRAGLCADLGEKESRAWLARL